MRKRGVNYNLPILKTEIAKQIHFLIECYLSVNWTEVNY